MRVGTVRVLMLILFLVPAFVAAQEEVREDVREARIWLDRGEEPVVQRGERLRLYYRSSHDAYVAVFHVDTDGSVILVYPTAPDEEHYVVGGRDYRLLFPRSPYWVVDEDPGIGYYFLIASPEPLDFSSFGYARYEHGWDLSRVGRAVYEDPYLAMDDYVAALIPDWEYVPYALDFIAYNVGGTHEYPRFMCYQCHGFRSYAQWNPYAYACSDFRVVIWDDPYYYPVYRYSGTRVVYATPLRGRPRFAFTARLAGQPWAPVVRRREAPRRTADFKESPVARPAQAVPTQRRATPSDAARLQGTNRPTRASVPAPAGVQRRPSANAAPGGVSRGGSTAPASPGRPVLQRRPSGSVGAGTPRTSPRSGLTIPRSGTTSSAAPRRPGSGVRPPASGTSRSVRPPQRTTRPPVTRSAPARSPTVTRAPSTQSRPNVRPPARAPATRSSPAVRPPSRPPATQARPTVRPRSGGTSRGSARPPVRRRGGGG